MKMSLYEFLHTHKGVIRHIDMPNVKSQHDELRFTRLNSFSKNYSPKQSDLLFILTNFRNLSENSILRAENYNREIQSPYGRMVIKAQAFYVCTDKIDICCEINTAYRCEIETSKDYTHIFFIPLNGGKEYFYYI